MFKLLFFHHLEMIKGHLKGIYLKIFDFKRYSYIYNLRGDYNHLNKVRKELVLKVKTILKENKINYSLISRIKTIGSFDRKEKYKQIINKKIIKNSSIGIKIITQNKSDCYKVKNILDTLNFKIISFNDFFKKPEKINKTNSVLKNKFFYRIKYKDLPIHIIIIPKYYCYIDLKKRKKYLAFVYNKIKLNKP